MSAPTRAPQDVVDELVHNANAVLASSTGGVSSPDLLAARRNLASAVDALLALPLVWNWSLATAADRVRDRMVVVVVAQQSACHPPARVSWWRRTFGADQ